MKQIGVHRSLFLYVAVLWTITFVSLHQNVPLSTMQNMHPLVNRPFVPFRGDIEDHYITVEGQGIPGKFSLAEDRNSLYT